MANRSLSSTPRYRDIGKYNVTINNNPYFEFKLMCKHFISQATEIALINSYSRDLAFQNSEMFI